MGLRGDRRGQAVQVGAVLLLAILVITLSLYQATVVPGENKQVEFNDYQDATADLADLRNAILRSAAQDVQSGVTVRTGSQYPARSLFVNPPPATGRLSSSPAANVTVSNVESAGDFQNVGSYLDAEGNALNVSTRSLVFDPSYNELDVAPVATAYGATYRAYDEPIFTSDQSLVVGNRITLVSVVGNLRAEGYDAPVTVEPVSAHTRTVSVSSEDEPLNLTIPTRHSATTWREELLVGELDPNGNFPDRYVTTVAPGPRSNTVNVSLEADATYELRLGRVEVHERSNSATERTTAARYLVSQVDRSLRTGGDGRIELVVEARDRYNNPVSNANVTFRQPSDKGTFERADGSNRSFPARTDENGRATVYYNATGYVGNLPVKAFLGTTEPAASERKVSYTVTNLVTEGDGGGDSGDTNVNPGTYVILDGAQWVDKNPQPDRYRVNVTLENQGTTDANVTAMRFSFYFEDDNNGQVSAATVYNTSGSEVFDLPIRSGFEEVPYAATVPENNGTVSYEFAFDIDYGGGDVEDYDPNHQTDFFVVEVVYDDAFVATYFIGFERP